MSKISSGNIQKLKSVANQFGLNHAEKKHELLLDMHQKDLPKGERLIEYYELLLFICAYPDSKKVKSLAESELKKISSFLEKSNQKYVDVFINSGLPYTVCVSLFSHTLLDWLLTQKTCKVSFNCFQDPSLDLNSVLKLTLPSLEKSETTSGLSNEELFEKLLINDEDRVWFLVNELSKLNHLPFIQDHLHEGLGICSDIYLTDKMFSHAYNRIAHNTKYIHSDFIKYFDYQKLLSLQLPKWKALSAVKNSKVVNVIKRCLVLKDRETDPVTYMDESSLRLYELERGVTIALYGMIPERQLPLESYVGYTLFKNGFPAAYGGAWVFGEHANFGINIFEPFRGGESGYLMCQLLRVYVQALGVKYFEIEPYQFGLNNKEGIKSGAFWFYYRYGFRPLDKKLERIALNEQKKIKARTGYRTNKNTLIRFTESPMALRLSKNNSPNMEQILQNVSSMIARDYNGNRIVAVSDCVKKFKNKTRLRINKNDKGKVLEECALWTQACKIKGTKLTLMSKMVKTKPKDLFAYQKLLLKFFSK